MTSLDISNNDIGRTDTFPDGWRCKYPDVNCGFVHTDGRIQNWAPNGSTSSGVIALANAIPNMKALTSVNLLKNSILVEQAQELVKTMRTKENLITLCGLSGKETKLDFSGQGLGAGDAVFIANEIKDNGALLSANLLYNSIGTEQAHTLGSILKVHPTLKSLCGNKGDETELDMSNKMMSGAQDAIMLVAEIADNGAMTSLNLAGQGLHSNGATIIAEVIKVIRCTSRVVLVTGSTAVVCYYLQDMGAMTILDISNNNIGQLTLPEGWSEEYAPSAVCYDKYEHIDGRQQASAPEGSRAEGVISLANAIPDMRAMTKIDVRNNNIGSEGKRALRKAAGVGFFGSRYVRLEFLSFYSKLK
jgi:hypothetical protein